MKYLSLLLIPLLLFMTSCTIDWNDEKDKKIAELERQIHDDTFKKALECSSVADKYKKLTQEISPGVYNYEYSFIETFYSKEKNDCLTIIKRDFTGDNMSKTWYFIIPSLALGIEGNIESCSLFSNFKDSSLNTNDCNLFNERMKELKGK